MPKLKLAGLSVLLLTVIVCNGSDVTRPEDINDVDAVYHLIIYDKVREFNLDLLDFSIPDTTLANLAPVDPEFYWLDLAGDSLDIQIDIQYPGAHDTLMSVPKANALNIKLFYGTLEIIGFDTAGGGQVPVRLSKDFTIRGEISARFEKWGSDTNYRRGWLLKYISDAAYSAGYSQGITRIEVNSASNPEYVPLPGLKSLSDIPAFAPGESVTVTVNGSNPLDIFRIRYPLSGSLYTLTLYPDSNNNFIAGFRLPGTAQYGHFLVEAISIGSFQETGIFRHEAIGVLFKIQ